MNNIVLTYVKIRLLEVVYLTTVFYIYLQKLVHLLHIKENKAYRTMLNKFDISWFDTGL